MTQTTRLFRIFVSSTFADLTAERNILQQKTFPALREYCRKKGVDFQAIDLRWGVSEEASLDQQTMNICLGEIRRCQALTPRPNFLVLLGQRYGWVPPPPQIPANDFEEMSHFWSKADRQLVETWYRRDDNVGPPAYVLLPRTGTEDWLTIEQQLVSALGQGARSTGWQGSHLLPYCASATHQEIAAGALEVDTPAEKVLCVFRDLEVPAASQVDTAVYCDPDASAIEELRRQLTQALPAQNILRVQAAWDAASRAPATTHLQAMANEVFERLRSQIDLELEAPASVVSNEAFQGLFASVFLDDEGQQHLAFARKHLEHFVGRSEALAKLQHHIRQNEGRVLVVQGAGGSGKTAFLSRAMQWMIAINPDVHVVARFIGTTPDSSSSRALLQSLCRELARRSGEDKAPIDGDYPALSQEFRKRLESFVHPLFLVLDALDQLPAGDPGRTLGWLPQQLGPAVRLIVSTRPGETEDLFRYRKTQMLPLDGLKTKEGQELLEIWLHAAGRTLQPRQRDHVWKQFDASASLPLYLRLAFEEARRWKSWEAPETLAVGIPTLLRHNFFDRLASEQHHGRTLVSRVLAYLAASRHGLSESELHDLLSRDLDVYARFLQGSHHLPADLVAIAHDHARHRNQTFSLPEFIKKWQALRTNLPQLREALQDLFSYRVPSLPVVLLARLRADLEPYLTTRSFDDTLLMGFYHRELGEVAANTFLADQAGHIHAHLAKYFERQADPESLGMWLGSRRYLRELPHHLIQAEDWPRLAGDEATPGVLTDLRFIQSKCTAGLTHDLVGDYNRALNVIPGGIADSTPNAIRLRHFSNFVSHQLSALSNYPAETFSVAVNYASSGAVVEQAECVIEKYHLPHLRRHPRQPLIPLRPACIRILEGHKNWVWTGAVKPDGKIFISGSEDNTIRVWDLDTGACLKELEGHDLGVLCVFLTPDGKRIVSGSEDNTIGVWDLEAGTCLRVLKGHTKCVTGVSVTPDGNRIVSCSVDKTIRVWNLETGACLKVLEGHERIVKSVSVTPDGKRIVSGSVDETIRVWNLETGVCLKVLEGHGAIVRSVSVMPDGKRFVSGSNDETIRVWDLKTGDCLQIFKGHEDGVQSVTVTPDGEQIVSGSDDNTIRVWDLKSGECLKVIKGHQGNVLSASVTPDGNRIVSTGGNIMMPNSSDNTIRVWDLKYGVTAQGLESHSDRVNSVLVTPNGKMIVSGSNDNTIRLWDLKTGSCLKELEGTEDIINSLLVTPDGKKIISRSNRILLGRDDKMQVVDPETGVCLKKLDACVSCVELSSNGKRMVSGSGYIALFKYEPTLMVWDLVTGSCLHVLVGHQDMAISVAMTSDGKRIVSGSRDKTLRVWAMDTGACLKILEGHQDNVNSVFVTRDAKRIVSGSGDKTIRVWDLETGACLKVLEGHKTSVWKVTVTPDGKRIISRSLDANFRVWNLETGECLHDMEGHQDRVIGVSLTQDGKWIISGSWDNTIRVWNMESGKNLCTYVLVSKVTDLTSSPTGDRIVAGTADGQIHILTPVNFTLCETPALTEL